MMKLTINLLALILFGGCSIFQSDNEYYLNYITEMNSVQEDVNIQTTEWRQLCHNILKLKYIDDEVEVIPTPSKVIEQGGSDCVGFAILSRAVITHKFHGYIICANSHVSHAIALYEDERGYYIVDNDTVDRIDGENGYITLKSLSNYNKFVSEKIILDR